MWRGVGRWLPSVASRICACRRRIPNTRPHARANQRLKVIVQSDSTSILVKAIVQSDSTSILVTVLPNQKGDPCLELHFQPNAQLCRLLPVPESELVHAQRPPRTQKARPQPLGVTNCAAEPILKPVTPHARSDCRRNSSGMQSSALTGIAILPTERLSSSINTGLSAVHAFHAIASRFSNLSVWKQCWTTDYNTQRGRGPRPPQITAGSTASKPKLTFPPLAASQGFRNVNRGDWLRLPGQ